MNGPTKFALKSGRLAGFAAEKAEPGETFRIVTHATATSDNRHFHVWLKHITEDFLLPTSIPIESIHRFLVLLHETNEADVYINDFSEVARVQVIESVKAGEMLFRHNISDITNVSFPGIEIKKSDAIIYGCRTDWRFSLYFDFRREVAPDKLSLDLGKLKKEATFYSATAAADAQLSLDDKNTAGFVFAEGKTDSKHLMSAMTKLNFPLGLSFSLEGYGGADLLKMCQYYARIPHAKPMIFIFDRDDGQIVKVLRGKAAEGRSYQEWGNNVYSMYLPIPPGRTDDTHAICIEFFYPDADIRKVDEAGNRLYLNREFNPTTGADSSHKLNCRDLKILKRPVACIIDHDVFEVETGKNVALSKEAFATAIYERRPPFETVDHSAFQPIFDVIAAIARPSRTK